MPVDLTTINNESIKIFINAYFKNPASLPAFLKNGNDRKPIGQWGELAEWPAGAVTNLTRAFHERYELIDEDLSGWRDKLTEVTEMDNMFYGCREFTGESVHNWKWNLPKVKKMRLMFSRCNKFNGDLSDWTFNSQPGELIDMEKMFNDSENFQGIGLNTWDVSKVQNMLRMFLSCRNFNGDLTGWDVSNVESMDYMFSGCRKFEGIGLNTWNVSRNTKTFSNMFVDCRIFNTDLRRWKVSQVKYMDNMFENCINFKGKGLAKWKVLNVTSMSKMFKNCYRFNGNITQWNISNVSFFNETFYNCRSFNRDLHNWNLSNVVVSKAERMFYGCDILPLNFRPPPPTLQNRVVLSNAAKAAAAAALVIASNAAAVEEDSPNYSEIGPEDEADAAAEEEADAAAAEEEANALTEQAIEVAEEIHMEINDVIGGETEMTPRDFFTINKQAIPFVIISKVGNGYNYNGNTLQNAKVNYSIEYVECKDDSASTSDFNQYQYQNSLKPNGREFVVVFINGIEAAIIKPDWWNENFVPGTSFFKATTIGNVKIMTKNLYQVNRNQKRFRTCVENETAYVLEPLTLEEIASSRNISAAAAPASPEDAMDVAVEESAATASPGEEMDEKSKKRKRAADAAEARRAEEERGGGFKRLTHKKKIYKRRTHKKKIYKRKTYKRRKHYIRKTRR